MRWWDDAWGGGGGGGEAYNSIQWLTMQQALLQQKKVTKTDMSLLIFTNKENLRHFS